MSIKNSVSGSKQVVSEIIDRNYGSWNQEFVIDKGSSDGISGLNVCSFVWWRHWCGKYREKILVK